MIVVGGGHAGCEAAYASARMNSKTLLITSSLNSIGRLSCNPAIGGLAKGQLVKEIDAFDGAMPLTADRAGIQFRMLNKSKGPAVWSPRAQMDRDRYPGEMGELLNQQKNLFLREATATGIVVNNGRVLGVIDSKGNEYCSECVILCNGTFLNGLMHVGMNAFPGGRYAEPPSLGLTESLEDHGFCSHRLKTGTPPLVCAPSVDLSSMVEQKGDRIPIPFSGRTQSLNLPQVSCFLTHTNALTHRIIKSSLHQSPLFTGKIKGIGPRYCPSIEDKVVRFPGKEGHQIFLEPEGNDSPLYYLNGFATSIPEQYQLKAIRTIPGLEKAEIARHGYAVEYDFFQPTQLKPSLETKRIECLFFAGQINGTSGYEEAAAQGLMAGTNAALKTRGKPPFVLNRDEAYIGVLIDDLVSKGTLEPYRMFTSRAEFRLLLRQDNADTRLCNHALSLGLLDPNRHSKIVEKAEQTRQAILWLEKESVDLSKASELFERKGLPALTQKVKIVDVLRRPEVTIHDAMAMSPDMIPPFLNNPEVAFSVQTEVKYKGYIAHQRYEAEKSGRLNQMAIPDNTDFDSVFGLLTESRQKLKTIRPQTIGQAARISGVTPSDVSILIRHVSGLSPNTKPSSHCST